MKTQLTFMNNNKANPTQGIPPSGAVKMNNLNLKKKRLVDLSPLHQEAMNNSKGFAKKMSNKGGNFDPYQN